MSVPARRRQVAYGRERGLSVRRACTLFSVARSALRYQGRKTVKDAGVIERMQELSAQYPRYGYRRIRIFLGRNGHRMSVGRAYRLWRAAGLQLPRKRPRKRVAAARPRPQAPSGPNQVWSYDFVFDHCANGQQLKCLTVTDEFTKEGLAIDVNARIRSPRVIDVLSRLVSARGAPSFLRSDNGPEFVSKALLSWIVAQGIGTALIEPGKPWQNGVAESFNGKFRDECLSLEWFRSRAEAKVIIETWRRHYNEVRPHSSLGYLTPNEFVARLPKAASRHATGQDAAVCGPSRPGPLHNPLRKEHMQKHGTPSQANRGPKNPGRSWYLELLCHRAHTRPILKCLTRSHASWPVACRDDTACADAHDLSGLCVTAVLKSKWNFAASKTLLWLGNLSSNNSISLYYAI